MKNHYPWPSTGEGGGVGGVECNYERYISMFGGIAKF